MVLKISSPESSKAGMPESMQSGKAGETEPGRIVELSERTEQGSTSPIQDIGRIKVAPKCLDPDLLKEACPAEALKKIVFSDHDAVAAASYSVVSLSSSSSAASSSSHQQEESGVTQPPNNLQVANNDFSPQFKQKMLERKTSRQGRQNQRWANESRGNHAIRLTTGCVPIMKDGSILFVSSSRKKEWILPKGGWERDESMEESAMREVNEEAGVTGILGPHLSEVEYETRKAKKRRQEREELLRQKVADVGHESSDPEQSSHSNETSHSVAKRCSGSMGLLSDDAIASMRDAVPVHTEETNSVVSITSDGSQQYSHVRMTLFPLYVTEVKEKWPEDGRCRKVVNIEKAIEMMESRPEFRAALAEVKEKGLHLARPGTQNP